MPKTPIIKINKIEFRVSDAERQMIESLANQERITISKLILKAIRFYAKNLDGQE